MFLHITHNYPYQICIEKTPDIMPFGIFFLLLIKIDKIVHYNKFPNLGAYHANFPNLKGPRVPSPNCEKKNPGSTCTFIQAPV